MRNCRSLSFKVAAVAGVVLVSLFSGTGCGLISSDITKVSFDLPSQTFTFNTSQFNIPPGNSVAVPCGSGQVVTDCCNPPAPLPTVDCTATPLVCEPNAQQTNVCTAAVPVSQSTTVMLKNQVPALSTATSIANITVKQIAYTVSMNTLNVDVPATTIYLAPSGVTNPNDPSAKMFGTMPPIPQMTTPSGTVMLAPDASATFSSFAHDLSMPFNIIAATTVKVPSGSPNPSGAITITVTGTLSASL
jgi:hypothetical protein